MSRRVTFYFARLNLIRTDDEDKYAFLLRTLQSSREHRARKYYFGFYDVQPIGEETDSHAQYIYGRLVKFSRHLPHRQVDPDTGKTVDISVPGGVVSEAPFFLHVEHMAIAFRTSSNWLTQDQFRREFARLIEIANDEFFVDAELFPISTELTVVSALRDMDTVSQVRVTLHPSNPSPKELFDVIDNRIKGLGADRYSAEVSAASEAGLDKDAIEADDIGTSLHMAEAGYGEARVEGTKDGRKVVVTSDRAPLTRSIIWSDLAEELLAQLKGAFNRITNGTDNDTQ